MNYVEPHWPDVQLFVIGDSHATFFKGHDGVNAGFDSIPGVTTRQTVGAIAWSLAKTGSTMQGRENALVFLDHAVKNGFRGWVLLSYGEIDVRIHIYKNAPKTGGVYATVAGTVDRYVGFIDDVRKLYPKLAVWAPIASQPQDNIFNPEAPIVGSEVERNFATLLFTQLLRRAMAPRNVPVFSLLDQMLRDDGKTYGDLLLPDRVHISQVLMPHTLRMLNETLGTTLVALSSPLELGHYPLQEFAEIKELTIAGETWLSFEFISAFYCAKLVLLDAARNASGIMEIRAGHDGKQFETFRVQLDGAPPADANPFVPIDRLSRFIQVRAANHRLRSTDLRIEVVATRLVPGYPGNGHSKAILQGLVDALLTQPVAPHPNAAPAPAPSVTVETRLGRSVRSFTGRP